MAVSAGNNIFPAHVRESLLSNIEAAEVVVNAHRRLRPVLMSLAQYYEECCQTRLGTIDGYLFYSRFTFDSKSHEKHNAADDAE